MTLSKWEPTRTALEVPSSYGVMVSTTLDRF